MAGKDRKAVRRTSSRQGRSTDRDDNSARSEGSRSRSRSRSRSIDPKDRLKSSSRPRGELSRTNSISKFKGRKDDRRSEGGSSRDRDRHRSQKEGRSRDRSSSRELSSGRERSHSRDRSVARERSRSRERDKQRDRSTSRERRRRDRSTSTERSNRRDRSRSRSRSLHRERSTSTERSDRRDRSRSRDRSKSGDRSVSRERGHSHDKSKSRDPSHSRERSSDRSKPKERGGSRERGKSRERSTSRERTDDGDAPIRRRRKSSKERLKRSTYVKSAAIQKKDKQKSDGRKSSVLGSLNAFLEEEKATAPAPAKDSGDRSVMTSASKIQRRKRSSMPLGSASVYGGQVTNRDDVRQRRRSRSFSAQDGEAASVSEERSEMRKERKSSVRSRTPSARTRHSVLNQERSEKRSVTDSSATSSLPSDRAPVLGESSGRLQRKLSLTSSNGAEVPPGFPVAAVDQRSTAPSDLESAGHSSGPTVLESTTKIRERQLRRAELSKLGDSSRSLTMNDLRTLRRKKSLQAMSPNEPPPRSISVSHEETGGNDSERPMHSSLSALSHKIRTEDDVEEKSRDPNSLSSRLETVGSKSLSTRSRKKSSSQSVASAPALSDKHKTKSPNVRKRTKSSSMTKESAETLAVPTDDEKDELAYFLGMPKPDEDEDEVVGLEHSGFLNDMNGSAASLDPSILTTRKEPVKQINSLAELYHDDDEDHGIEGVEGEIGLKDDSTQVTQESSIDAYKQQHGTPTRLNQSVVMFDSAQLQQAASIFGSRAIGPGSLSPHSSSLSGTSDNNRSPGCLKRKVGQVKADSPNLSRRVSWVELPLTNPGTLLVKSTDTDGTNERETAASADLVTSVDDLHDEKKLADAMKTAEGLQNSNKSAKSKKNSSLDAALENDKVTKKRYSADERTVGTTATATSEATMKTHNKTEGTVSLSRTKKSKEANVTTGYGPAEDNRPAMLRATSSGSLSRSSRSSSRKGKDSPSDGSSSTLSRRSSKEEDSSSKRVQRKLSSRSKDSNATEKSDSPKESNTGSHRRTGSLADVELVSPRQKNRSMKRSISDPKNSGMSTGSPAKVGSKLASVGSGDSQSSGEPTNEKSLGKEKDASSKESSQLRKKSTYLNKRSINKCKSQGAKSSVKSSLDKLLEKLGGDDVAAHVEADDHRSISSEGGMKNRKKMLRSRRPDSDDRSVSSAPGTGRRKTRRHSEKLKPPKKSAAWWNLERKADD